MLGILGYAGYLEIPPVQASRCRGQLPSLKKGPPSTTSTFQSPWVLRGPFFTDETLLKQVNPQNWWCPAKWGKYLLDSDPFERDACLNAACIAGLMDTTVSTQGTKAWRHAARGWQHVVPVASEIRSAPPANLWTCLCLPNSYYMCVYQDTWCNRCYISLLSTCLRSLILLCSNVSII